MEPREPAQPIEWSRFSPKVQAHGRCRYCEAPAEFMRKHPPHPWRKGYAPFRNGQWVALCRTHAKIPVPGTPSGARPEGG